MNSPAPQTLALRAVLILAAGLCAPAFGQTSAQQSPVPAGSVAQTPRQAPSPLKIENAWIRPSVPGQQGTGGYMKLTARTNQHLIGVSSPVAGVAEVHEMKMQGEVMQMRPLKSLALPAGRTVEFKAGGLHLMLMDLKQPLTEGSTVPLTLLLRDAKGVESRVETRLRVGSAAPAGAAAGHVHRH